MLLKGYKTSMKNYMQPQPTPPPPPPPAPPPLYEIKVLYIQ